jgi:hypothetical protein
MWKLVSEIRDDDDDDDLLLLLYFIGAETLPYSYFAKPRGLCKHCLLYVY